ncbi:MAG TPA: DMT family transporter [Candidatus Binatia bacterium]
MIYLLLAIFGSGVIPVIFRAFEGWRVNLFWAIPVNYLTCVFIGALFTGSSMQAAVLSSRPWIVLAALQGFLLAVNFFLLAYTAQRAGVAIAALASRLSVAIPSVLAFVLYGDSLTAVKIAGLMAALAALYLCTAPEKNSSKLGSRLFHLLPLLVFATFGCYFTILKYLQSHYLDQTTYHAYVMLGFVFAFVSSVAIGLGKGGKPAANFRAVHVGAGLALGLINYFTVYALLRVLAMQGWESSQVYPIYSVGVVGVSTLLAFLFFRERLSRQKALGLGIGVLAVALLNR